MTDTLHERIYICVDDTDDLTKSTSTGAIADEIARRVCSRFDCAINMGITRHQLLLDERVPYTSHNSSMCFDAVLPTGATVEIDEIGWEVIHALRAESSNPGLCILPVGAADKSRDDICNAYAEVVSFGLRAKEEFILIEEARQVARMYPEMILKGEGDSGQGMIGALAGVGLRITGNDGRFRGKYDLSELKGDVCTSRELNDAFANRYGVSPLFLNQDWNIIDPGCRIVPVTAAKAVLHSGSLAFICEKGDQGFWKPRSKDAFNKKRRKRDACGYFVADPDQEERFHEMRKPTCGSCLYRRLTSDGYLCMAGHIPTADEV